MEYTKGYELTNLLHPSPYPLRVRVGRARVLRQRVYRWGTPGGPVAGVSYGVGSFGPGVLPASGVGAAFGWPSGNWFTGYP